MAMLTPAQNPRGLARIIFIGSILLHRSSYGVIRQWSVVSSQWPLTTDLLTAQEKTHGAHVRGFCMAKALLVVLEFLDADDVLLAVLFDGAGDRAVLGFGANVAVILLVGFFIEINGDFLFVLLGDDHRGARLFDAEIAFGAGALAFERHSLLFAAGIDAGDENEGQSQESQAAHEDAHVVPPLQRFNLLLVLGQFMQIVREIQRK